MTDFVFNMDYENRDLILGIPGEWENKRGSGSIRRFDYVNVDVLRKLIGQKYIDPEDRENSSPSVAQIYEFMIKHPQVLVQGYAVSPHRKDYRVTITTLFALEEKVNPKIRNEFKMFSANADELITDTYLYAWWD